MVMSKPLPPLDLAMVQDFFDHVYQDRGMVKWQGFYLSDHTSALNQQSAQHQHINAAQPQQSLNMITTWLQQAYLTNRPITIQLNERDSNDQFLPNIIGKVTGYYDTDIVLNGQQLIPLTMIRHLDWQ